MTAWLVDHRELVDLRHSYVTALLCLVLSMLVPVSSEAAYVFWWSTAGGDWNNAANWSSNPSLPGASDDAYIGITGTWIITHSSGTHSVRSLSCEEMFKLTGGTLSIAAASQCPNGFLFEGGTLAGTGSLSMASNGYWLAGTISNNEGVTNNGIWDISGTGTKSLTSTLINNGVINQNGTIDIKNGGYLENKSLKLYEIKSDTNLANSVGDASIMNRGTIRKSTTNGVTEVHPNLNNVGTIEVATGTMQLYGGGAFNTGKASITSTSMGLQFMADTFNMMSDSSIGGTGKASLEGATLQIPMGHTFTSSLDGAFSLNSGTVTGDGGQFLNTRNMKWSNAALSGLGNLRNDNTLEINGSANKTFLNSQIGNYNTIYHMGFGSLVFSQGSQLHNIDGDYFLYSDASFLSADGTGSIINNSRFIKDYSFGTSQIQTRFDNYGQIHVDGGAISLYGGGTFRNCGVSTSYPAIFAFYQGNYTIDGEMYNDGSGYAQMAGGTANFTYGANAEFHISDGALQLAGTTFTGEGNLVNYGNADWSSSTISGGAHMVNNGTLTITGSAAKNLQTAQFYNAKDIVQTAATGPTVDSASTMTLQGGSTYELRADSGISGTGLVRNGGTLLKRYSSGESTIETPFNNEQGTIDVQDGRIRFTGGGTWQDGGAQVSAGKSLTLSTGTYTLNGILQSAGTGNVYFPSGTINLSLGAQARFNNEQGLHMCGATISGPGALINRWYADWSAGSMIGDTRFTNEGTLSLIGSGVKTIRASRMYNPSTITHADTGALDFREASVLDNGGLYRLQSDASLTCTDGGSSITNGGEFAKISSSGISTIQPAFSNQGLISVNSGTLRLSGGGDFWDGSASAASTSRLEFRAGNFRMRGRFIANGSGSAALYTNMNLDLGATADFDMGQGFHFAGGVISGTGSVINRGAGSWANGLVADQGTLTNYGILTLLRAEERAIRGGKLLTFGTVNHERDTIYVDEKGVIEVAASGIYNLMDDLPIRGEGLIDNRGVLNKTTGLSESFIECRLDNLGTVRSSSGAFVLGGPVAQVEGSVLTGGTWIVDQDCDLEIIQADYFLTNRGVVVLDWNSRFRQIDRLYRNEGTLRLLNGRSFTCTEAFTNSGTLELDGGSFTCGKNINTGLWLGHGIIVGGIANRGIVAPAAGADSIAITGSYNQDDTATLRVTLNGGEDPYYGKIITAGTCTIAGRLEIVLAPGFTPTQGQKFIIIDAKTRSGEFSTLTLPTLAGGLTFNPIYTSFGLVLVVGYPMSDVSQLASVVDARGHSLNTYVSLPGIVSAVYSDQTFYVQDPNRLAGLRVSCSDDLPIVGQRIQVTGSLYASSVCLSLGGALWAAYPDAPVPPMPLFMQQQSLGGVTAGHQEGVLDGLGVNNIGLLVKTAGRVTYVQPYQFAYIDDGSGLTDGNALGPGGAPVKGVRVVLPPNGTIPLSAMRAMVTGISCRTFADGYYRRGILVRSRGEIITY